MLRPLYLGFALAATSLALVLASSAGAQQGSRPLNVINYGRTQGMPYQARPAYPNRPGLPTSLPAYSQPRSLQNPLPVQTSQGALNVPAENQSFPIRPDARTTPGKMCEDSRVRRYPEKIAYCERDVSVEEKDSIFDRYRSLGFRIDPNDRRNYKIDHYIPLCAGGSNDISNLWPQNVRVYLITDPIEEVGCEKLALGKIRQADVIQKILGVKQNLSTQAQVLKELQSL